MKYLITLLLVTSTMITNAQTTMKPTVDVTGEGIVKIVPDQVTITVRVEHTGSNPQEVKSQNDATVNEVFKFLKQSGIDSKHVTSEYINLTKNYDYNKKTYNYVANQTISIFLEDLSKYEGIMDGLLRTGINRINGVNFSSSKMSKLQSEARKKAVLNAKMKATEYASVLSQTIGKAVHISEFQNLSTPAPYLRSAMMDGESQSKQTLSPGEMEIAVKVQVRFELN